MKTIKEAHELGLKNAEFHVASAEILTREANITLSIITSAALAAMGYAVHLAEDLKSPALIGGASASCLFLFYIAYHILDKCLKATDIHCPYNEPKALFHPDHEWEDVLKADLDNLSAGIDFNLQRNKTRGGWLNTLRTQVFLLPLFFAIGAVVGLLVAGVE